MEPFAASESSSESAQNDELYCPLCQYDLRGLTEPRCPECGYRFDWDELRDRSRHRHPFLFEHHPERNIRSFCHTALAGWRPVHFWQTLRPQMTLVPRRLIAYWSICTLVPCFLAAFLVASRIAIEQLSPASPSPFIFRAGLVIANPKSTPWNNFLGRLHFIDRLFGEVALITLFILGWTVATLLTLLIFQQSMAKAKVLPMHVVRCLAYSFDFGLWLTLSVGVFLALFFVAGRLQTESFLPWLEAGIVLFGMGKLWMAYRCYLQFDHAFFVILSSQVIAFLSVLLVIVNLDPVTRIF